MKKLLFLFLLLAARMFGATYFVNQAGSGTADGSTLGNAASMATLASRTNSAGDNIIFNGTITSNYVVTQSGGVGNPITYTFASGAKFSAGNWFQSGSNGNAAFYATGKNNITVDGASVGIIECTSNGTGLATQTDCVGIFADGSCSNWIIKNLTIQNIYVRTQGAENNPFGNCIKFNTATGSNILIDGCTVNNAGSLIYFSYGVGLATVEIRNCTAGINGIGSVVFGDTSNGATTNGALIHDNVFTASLAWAGQPAIHKNLIFCFADQTTSRIDGLKVYNNKFTGFMADNSTSFLFMEGYIYSPLLYCNVFAPSTNDFTGNGYIVIKGTQNCVIGNNTFYGATDGVAIGTTAWGALETGLIIKNNVTSNVATGVNDNGEQMWAKAGASFDYNVYYPSTTNFLAGTGFDTFAQWKTEISSQISGGVGGDSHSTQSTPNLNTSYYPIAASSAIGTGSNFADMSAFYTTDKSGVAWAGGTGWGGGALKALGSGGAGGSSLSGKITLTGNATIK